MAPPSGTHKYDLPDHVEAEQHTLRSVDVAARTLAAVLMVGLVTLYILMGIALHPIMDNRLGGWFTWVCWAAFMAAALNLYIPAYSFIATLWLTGSVKQRQQKADEYAQQRNNLALMAARSRTKYGEAGPPESMSGDESPDRSKHRDVGAGRR